MKYTEDEILNRLRLLGFNVWADEIIASCLGSSLTATINLSLEDGNIIDDIDFINEVDAAMRYWDI